VLTPAIHPIILSWPLDRAPLQEDIMPRVPIFALSVGCLLFAGCGSSGWVHPTKPPEMFTQDYNTCENEVIRDPKLQVGSRYLVTEATENCMKKKGWEIVEKE
jgi:hypothetical protein